MSKWCIQATWSDVPHLSEEDKINLAAAYSPHERDARMLGVPALGSGAVYPVSESDITCEPFEFPAWYRHAYGMDVGWNRTAALWGALDPEDDVLYLWGEHYRGKAEPAAHAAAIRARGIWIPGVIDPASRGRNQHDGQQLYQVYVDLGLDMLTLADNAVEAGIYEVWQRLSTGRLKVFRTLQNFFTEYRIYRRDERGKIVKEGDHLMDCCRYLCRSGLQRAAVRPREEWGGRPGSSKSWGVGRGGLESGYEPFAEAWGVGGKVANDRVRSWGGMGRLD